MFSTNQTTTKTFNFSPSGADFVLAAFSRIQVRPTEITPTHMYNARMALNFVLSEWSNNTPNLWEVDLQVMPLSQGVETYAVPAPTVMILDLYLSMGSPQIDRYLWPVSRTEYASYSNKLQQGVPTVYWYDRLISQNVTFYPVPDGSGPYTIKFYSVRQTQDADVSNGYNVEIPYRFYEAYVAGLAWKLAETYAPQLEDKMFARYSRAMQIALTQDTENVGMSIMPGLAGYYT
jgi:hypothetical protein